MACSSCIAVTQVFSLLCFSIFTQDIPFKSPEYIARKQYGLPRVGSDLAGPGSHIQQPIRASTAPGGLAASALDQLRDHSQASVLHSHAADPMLDVPALQPTTQANGRNLHPLRDQEQSSTADRHEMGRPGLGGTSGDAGVGREAADPQGSSEHDACQEVPMSEPTSGSAHTIHGQGSLPAADALEAAGPITLTNLPGRSLQHGASQCAASGRIDKGLQQQHQQAPQQHDAEDGSSAGRPFQSFRQQQHTAQSGRVHPEDGDSGTLGVASSHVNRSPPKSSACKNSPFAGFKLEAGQHEPASSEGLRCRTGRKGHRPARSLTPLQGPSKEHQPKTGRQQGAPAQRKDSNPSSGLLDESLDADISCSPEQPRETILRPQGMFLHEACETLKLPKGSSIARHAVSDAHLLGAQLVQFCLYFKVAILILTCRGWCLGAYLMQSCE